MINKSLHNSCNQFLVLLSVLFLGCYTSVPAQAVEFNMQVEPEISIEVLQDLNFGTVVANSGIQRVSLGDFGMGIFEIRAFSAQHAFLSISSPENLQGEETRSDSSSIPLEIEAVYSVRPGNYADLTFLEDNSAWVSLGSGENASSNPDWQTGYVYVFGEIEVGDIGQGIYSGTLILNVTYQ